MNKLGWKCTLGWFLRKKVRGKFFSQAWNWFIKISELRFCMEKFNFGLYESFFPSRIGPFLFVKYANFWKLPYSPKPTKMSFVFKVTFFAFTLKTQLQLLFHIIYSCRLNQTKMTWKISWYFAHKIRQIFHWQLKINLGTIPAHRISICSKMINLICRRAFFFDPFIAINLRWNCISSRKLSSNIRFSTTSAKKYT